MEKQDFLQENGDFVRWRMNDDATLYHNSNSVQTRDAIICLEEYTPRMKWHEGECRIIDIGCGDGSVTNIIKKIIPQNYKEFIGCDISERMVHYANENYKNKKSYFRVLDIEGPLPEELEEGFDHVFSLYTLHWIKNQEKAFTNIYNMLTKGGDCLLSFLAYMPINTALTAVANSTKWKNVISSSKRFILPYHNLQEPEKFITNMSKKIGFTDIEVNCKQMNITYTIENLKNTIRSINPFPMPKERFDIFLEDYIEVMRDMRLIDNVYDDDIEIIDTMTATIPYNLIVVYATKS